LAVRRIIHRRREDVARAARIDRAGAAGRRFSKFRCAVLSAASEPLGNLV
jgi:hypothetical protein